MKRPSGIVWFEWIMLGSMALITINGWLILRQLGNRADPGFAAGLLVGVIGTALVTFATFATLTLFVSRRRSNVAKWILVTVAVVSFPFTLMNYIHGEHLGVPLMGLIECVGRLFACGLLFTDQSRRWFRGEDFTLGAVFE